MEDIHTQLQNAVAKRKDLSAELQKLQGKLEIAKQNLDQVESECEELGVDPNELDTLIDTLTEEYEQRVSAFVQSVEELEEQLQQYK